MRLPSIAPALTLAVALAASAETASERDVAGVWAWHDAWQDAPPEIRSEPGQRLAATASALIVNFCPDGEFRMATGVFWRYDAGISLGSSDGIAVYRGSWSRRGEALVVSYRLVSAELAADREGFNAESQIDVAIEPAMIEGLLAFPHRWWWAAKSPVTTVYALRPQRAFTPGVQDTFVQCAKDAERSQAQ